MNGERIDCAYHYFKYFMSVVCGKCQDIISIIHFKKEGRKEGRKRTGSNIDDYFLRGVALP